MIRITIRTTAGGFSIFGGTSPHETDRLRAGENIFEGKDVSPASCYRSSEQEQMHPLRVNAELLLRFRSFLLCWRLRLWLGLRLGLLFLGEDVTERHP